MARPPNIRRPVSIHTHLPEDVWTRLSLHLLSDAQGKVPRGAYSAFLEERISEFFDTAILDIGPWLDASGPPLIIKGSPHSIDRLKAWLEAGRR